MEISISGRVSTWSLSVYNVKQGNRSENMRRCGGTTCKLATTAYVATAAQLNRAYTYFTRQMFNSTVLYSKLPLVVFVRKVCHHKS